MDKPLEQGWSPPLWSEIKSGEWHKERLDWIERFEAFNKERLGKAKGLVNPTFEEGSKVMLSAEFKELVQEGLEKGFLWMTTKEQPVDHSDKIDLTISFDYSLFNQQEKKQ